MSERLSGFVLVDQVTCSIANKCSVPMPAQTSSLALAKLQVRPEIQILITKIYYKNILSVLSI